MRKSVLLTAAMTLLFSASAVAQSTTTTINVDWNHIGTALCGYFTGTRNITFTDTVGSNWSYLKVRIPLAVTRTEPGSGPGPASTVSIAINGSPIGDPTVVANNSFTCGPYITYEWGVESLPGYHAFGQNTFTINSVGGAAGNSGEFAELIFTTEPRKFAFDLVPNMTQKLLIHKRPTDIYPSPWQVETNIAERPRFRFRGAVTSQSGNVEADVWLRVVDPADPSPYLPVHEVNDNRDPQPRGVLMTRGCADASCRAAAGDALKIHAQPGGVVELELEATGQYAGDNYILEASFDPQFTCATAGANGLNLCARSGTVTAWKRMYVEKDRMFTAGAMITQDVVPCTTQSCPATTIIHVDDAAAVAHAQQLRLIHAPRFDGAGPMAFYYENVNVVRVNRHANTVEVSNPAQPYFGPDFVNGVPIAYLADAVGQIGNSDLFDANTQNVADLFVPSFVEYAYLTDDPAPFVPFRAIVTGGGAVNEELNLLGRKWFRLSGDDNVQHLIAANASYDVNILGLTAAFGGSNFAWIFAGSVNGQVHNANRRWALNGEVTAHELGHEWRVNAGGNGGHCVERQWQSAARWCTMHGSYDDNGNCHGVCPEFYDTIVAFHYVVGDSEYLQVRSAADPFPQN